MKVRHRLWILMIVFPLFMAPSLTRADADIDETARLIAILLDSGRVTIGVNQSLINDPEKGDKGFTSEVFEAQMVAMFKERTGIDLAHLEGAAIPENAKPLLRQLVEFSKLTIDRYQLPLNIKGIRYKGLIPATFGTETAGMFSRWSGVYLKQTAPDKFLRNPKNKADEVESAFLQKLATLSKVHSDEHIVSDRVNNGKAVQVMLPLYYRKDCLNCHGEPKGERDITGGLKEGGKEHELAGAISVRIPLP